MRKTVKKKNKVGYRSDIFFIFLEDFGKVLLKTHFLEVYSRRVM